MLDVSADPMLRSAKKNAMLTPLQGESSASAARRHVI